MLAIARRLVAARAASRSPSEASISTHALRRASAGARRHRRSRGPRGHDAAATQGRAASDRRPGGASSAASPFSPEISACGSRSGLSGSACRRRLRSCRRSSSACRPAPRCRTSRRSAPASGPADARASLPSVARSAVAERGRDHETATRPRGTRPRAARAPITLALRYCIAGRGGGMVSAPARRSARKLPASRRLAAAAAGHRGRDRARRGDQDRRRAGAERRGEIMRPPCAPTPGTRKTAPGISSRKRAEELGLGRADDGPMPVSPAAREPVGEPATSVAIRSCTGPASASRSSRSARRGDVRTSTNIQAPAPAAARRRTARGRRRRAAG